MSVYGPSSSPLVTGIGVGTGADAYSALITSYINTIADGSTASLDDKLNAWANLGSLVLTPSSSSNPQSVLYQINKSDYQRASNAYLNSDFAQQVQQVSGQYGAYMLAHQGGGGSNFAQTTLNALNSFSSDDQKMIFYGQGMEINGMRYEQGGWIDYNSLSDWKAALTQQSAAYVAQQTPGGTVADSTTAGATADSTITDNAVPRAANDAAKLALTTLTQHGGTATTASIALQVLLNSQEHNAAGRSAAISRTAKAGTGTTPTDDNASEAASPRSFSANAAQAAPLNQVA